jgi:hypothetical protein
MRRTALVDPHCLEAIARRRFQYRWRSARARQSIPIPCLPTSTSWRPRADRRGALEPGFLPWRCFPALADDASSPRWIRERSRRVGRPRPDAVLFPASLFVRRRSWRAPQRLAKPKSEPERSSCYVRGTKQPTCAYRFSFWINPIGALTRRQLHHSIIQTATEKRPFLPSSRPEKMEQMVPNDQKFLPIASSGWAGLKPGNGIRRPGRWSQAGKGANQVTVAFRERGRRRTRQDQISRWAVRPGEIADHEIRTERRKLVSSAGRTFSERALRKDDPAV